jgi:hypothetical protein
LEWVKSLTKTNAIDGKELREGPEGELVSEPVGKSLARSGQTPLSAHYAARGGIPWRAMGDSLGKAARFNARAAFCFSIILLLTEREKLGLCSFFKNKLRFQAAWVGLDSPLFAHFTASVFMGSTSSHFKHRSSVLPVRSVIAIMSFLHFGQR